MANYKVALRQGINAHIAARVAQIKERLAALDAERITLEQEVKELRRNCTHKNLEDTHLINYRKCSDCGSVKHK